jgi:hypothetical protein
MIVDNQILDWLRDGDVSLQYQVHQHLLGKDRPDLQSRIATEGWGRQYLAARGANGHWGKGFYQPKWTSTHYTLLDLRNLGILPGNPECRATAEMVLRENKGGDGGINPAKTTGYSDVCVTGMALNYCSYFRAEEAQLRSMVDFLLSQQMPDGGFNCYSNSIGAVHSSVHTSLSVLEGILEYGKNGYAYRIKELQGAAAESQEFLLVHKLFRSHRTGAVIRPAFKRFHYPSRWFYDILRAMVYFSEAGTGYDPRMQDALDIIRSKRGKDGKWKLAAHYPGQQHFQMDNAGKPSRWITLWALKVLKSIPFEAKEI